MNRDALPKRVSFGSWEGDAEVRRGVNGRVEGYGAP